ncbi:hypothetical protein Pam5_60 [Pseudanabaena phage Pam5]|nr:hypothetical protein Pam5_60 [Pseudanabaena phage Pam5]
MPNVAPAPALAKLTPQETNARMEACLERISGRRPVFNRRMMFPSDGPAYSVTETANWKCATESQRNEALAAVEFALRPAEPDAIGAALYTLRIMTRGRAQASDADREAEAVIWLEHLRRFPADIVLTTLRNWPTRPNGQWWPVWHEVQKDLDAQTSARRLLAEHIRASKCLPAPDAEPEMASDEQREQAAARAKEWTQKRREEQQGGRWKPRDAEVIKREMAKEDLRLSSEALATFDKDQLDRAVDDPGTAYQQWEGRAA